MKGIVINILEKFLRKSDNDELWEKIQKEDVENEIYIPIKTYPDGIVLKMVSSVAEGLQLTANQTLEAFGQFMFFELNKKYSDFLDEFETSKEFILALDKIIHVEVKKMMINSEPPEFRVLKDTGEELVIEYLSQRGLCSLAKGLFSGLQKSKEFDFEFTHSKCKHKGDESCEFTFQFQEKENG